MQCPYCKSNDSRVVDSRLAAGGTVTWRRRECDGCKKRFTTYERVEYSLPTVVKKMDSERHSPATNSCEASESRVANGLSHKTSSRKRQRHWSESWQRTPT